MTGKRLKKMTIGYQMESSHVADYHLYTLPGVDYTLRGPYVSIDGKAPSISFLGAAQTFGTFCNYPFPNILGEMVSANVLNLARGGAGPDLYLSRPKIFEYVNKTDCCIVQIMSARSSHNSYMRVIGGGARVEIIAGANRGLKMLGHKALEQLCDELPNDTFLEIVEESRNYFLGQMEEIAKQITVPKVLLFVGKNPPLPQGNKESAWTLQDLVGTHPHMVTEVMIDKLSHHFDATVISHGSRGMHMQLLNRFTGEPTSVKRSETDVITTHKVYIPPLLHVKTALKLSEPVSQILHG